MPSRIEHKIENGMELKRCGKCKTYKPLDAFHTSGGRSWDNLCYACIECVNRQRTPGPRRGAVDRYNAIHWRVANEEGYLKKGIKVKVSKEDFVEWYTAHHFRGCHIDRIDDRGHYELSNMQLISQSEHNFKIRQDNLERLGIVEPEGMRYCYGCNSMKSESEFYKKKHKVSKINPKGLSENCKECDREKRMERYYNHKDY